jgi:dihydroorotase
MNSGFLIQNGTVYDGAGNAGQRLDVRVKGSSIAEIGRNLPLRGETVLTASGLLVSPGLIDLHTHVFTGMGQFAIAPEEAGLRTGVTTMLDTGTGGALTYPAFHRLVVERAAEDIFVLLNISIIGCLQGHPKVPPFMGELSDARYAHVPSAVACVQKYRDRCIGMKTRLTKGLANNSLKNERAGLQGALEAAIQTGTFLMIHHVNSAIPVDQFLGVMRGRDIMTHLYHPHPNSPFSRKSRRPIAALLEARERGVIFDVGHGVGSFGWEVAEPACQEHGFWPDTISSDIHQFNLYGPVFDLPTTMNKFLHLGMPLAQIIRAASYGAAQAMRLEDRFGLLKTGRQADITLLKIENGRFEFQDVLGKVRTAKRRLVPVAVMKRGQYYPCQHDSANSRVHPPKL